MLKTSEKIKSLSQKTKVRAQKRRHKEQLNEILDLKNTITKMWIVVMAEQGEQNKESMN